MPPFEKDAMLSGSHVSALSEWLQANADPKTVIAPGYTVLDLVNDLDAIDNGMWSDGIDAMGEDA